MDIKHFKSKIDIVEVANNYTKLFKKGKNLVGLSPFVQEKTPSFVVSQEKQIFKDYSSGIAGDVIELIQKKENKTFKDAISYLAKMFCIEIEQKEKEKVDILELSKQFYKFNLVNTTQGIEVSKYLEQKRMLKPETIEKFDIGLALSGGLDCILDRTGYTVRERIENGLISVNQQQTETFDCFQNRVIIPINDHTGRCVGFGSRIYLKNDTRAKYVNSNTNEKFNKSEILFGLDKSDKRKNFVFLVEGYMDVIQMHNHGIENVVATMGTSLTDKHIESIKQHYKNVIVMFDSDDAGQNSAQKALPRLAKAGVKTKNIVLVGFKDIDEFLTAKTVEEFKEIVKGGKK